MHEAITYFFVDALHHAVYAIAAGLVFDAMSEL
jgi:hypothetical protein